MRGVIPVVAMLMLGMMRRFLGPDGQARWAQARLDAVMRIGEVANQTGAAFVVVTGDVFEHNQVERQTILRACEALKRIEVPVVLLPGNHDALEPGSLWTSSQWLGHAPELYAVTTSGELEPARLTNLVQAWTVGARWALENDWGGRPDWLDNRPAKRAP